MGEGRGEGGGVDMVVGVGGAEARWWEGDRKVGRDRGGGRDGERGARRWVGWVGRGGGWRGGVGGGRGEGGVGERRGGGGARRGG